MRAVVDFFFSCWYNVLLFNLKVFSRKKTIYFIDIDNTIANSYPTLKHNFRSEVERIESIEPLPGLTKILLNNYAPRKRIYIFITARSIKVYFTTIKWLQDNGLRANFRNVILVSSPSHKLELVKTYYKPYRTVYIDDLSYNHENGEVKFYHNEIKVAKSLPIRYFGKGIIDRINSKGQ